MGPEAASGGSGEQLQVSAARAAEVEEKLQRLREWMTQRGGRAVVLARVANFAWVTGGGRSYIQAGTDLGAAWAVITARRAAVVTSNIEAPRLRAEELAGVDWELIPYPWWEADGLARALIQAMGPPQEGRLLADVALPPQLGAAEDATHALSLLRSRLLPAETERAARLGLDTALALEGCARQLAPGQSEWEIAGALAAACLARGVEPVVRLVAADERAYRFRHPLPTARPLRQYLLLAVCGMRHGLVVSATRLVHFGPPPDDLLRRWRVAAQVDAEMIAASRPGQTAGAVLAAAQRAYAQAGFPEEWTLHHQGGLAGYASREWRATPGGSQELAAGQLVAWNPSVAGAKSEDTALVRAQGMARLLTRTGDWPEVALQTVQGEAVPRPTILVR